MADERMVGSQSRSLGPAWEFPGEFSEFSVHVSLGRHLIVQAERLVTLKC